MRLHLLRDEKIVNRTIQLFEEVFPEDNRYIIIYESSSPKYVDDSRENVFFTKYDTDEFWNLVGDVHNYSYIIIHFLTVYAARFIRKINHPRICWIEWGGDLYNTLLAVKGYQLFRDNNLAIQSLYPSLPLYAAKCKYSLSLIKNSCIVLPAIRKIKYFIPDSTPDEYPLFQHYYPKINLEVMDFFYYPIDMIISGEISRKTVSGNSIIIGNSASCTNNHLYILNLLHTIGVDQQIVIPLSYGGNQYYKDKVMGMGEKLFDGQFTPITSFLPLQDFNQILLSACSFIYGNLRQEAVGNILAALYLGGKVFLEEQNPLYSYYKRLGLIIFSVSELSKEILSTRLNEDLISRNRSILAKMYSADRLRKIISSNFA